MEQSIRIEKIDFPYKNNNFNKKNGQVFQTVTYYATCVQRDS